MGNENFTSYKPDAVTSYLWMVEQAQKAAQEEKDRTGVRPSRIQVHGEWMIRRNGTWVYDSSLAQAK